MHPSHWILLIFIVTYFLIVIQRLPGFKIDRPSGVLIGATLLILSGFITTHEAFGFIDMNVITFLLGMMIMVAYLEFAGFFEFVALWLVNACRSPSQLLIITMASSAAFSAVFVNDTICLLFTPILVKAARYLNLRSLPYLIAIATASNIGSALTITGNPQNMYIGIQSNIPFLRFMLIMAVPVVVCLLLDYLALRLLFPQEVNKNPLPKLMIAVPHLNKRLTAKALGALALTLGLFIAGVGYPLSALIGAALVIVLGNVPPRNVLQKIDGTLLLFFAGLFVVMGAFDKASYLKTLTDLAMPYLTGTGFLSTFTISALTTALSNLISNVPAVMLMQPLIVKLGGGERLWILLAMASTFAGNLTLVGSVANLIVAEKAEAQGLEFRFMSYLRVGLPLTLASLLIGTLWLYWVL